MQRLTPEQQFKMMWRFKQILKRYPLSHFKLTQNTKNPGKMRHRHVSGAKRRAYRFLILLTHYYENYSHEIANTNNRA